jgi:DNA-binding NarL/FixJ family response regulator
MATVFLRVVVADDSLVLREGVVRLLEAAGFDVVAEAGDGEQLLAAVRAHVPDAAAVDIRMPPTHSDEGGRAALAIRAAAQPASSDAAPTTTVGSDGER